MVIEINTETLTEIGITADDFLYLYLLYSRDYAVLEKLKLKPDTKALQTKGLVKLGEGLKFHIIRQDFLDLFQASFDQMWSELLSYYPIKVSCKGTERILRARDSTAKANQKARTKYKSIIGKDKTKHDRIVTCLKNELIFRKKGDSLGFMKMLPTWVNSYEWDNYENIDGTETTGEVTRRITRRL
tara:strand:- start:61 stop:618 length:558 start_codon:yes stop_codon:yes gene_type:complete